MFAHSTILFHFSSCHLKIIDFLLINTRIKVRANLDLGKTNVKSRQKPSPNYDAISHFELIGGSAKQFLEPNFTCNTTNQELKKVKEWNGIIYYDFFLI